MPPLQLSSPPGPGPDDVDADADTDAEAMALAEAEEEDEQNLEELSPPPHPSLRELSALASWTVSTYKPGCGVAALLSPSPSSFWQSDGPQPHRLTAHFPRLVRVVRLRVRLDFGLDESYTPTRMQFAAGTGGHDLVDFAEWRGESPRGWVEIPLRGCGGAGASRRAWREKHTLGAARRKSRREAAHVQRAQWAADERARGATDPAEPVDDDDAGFEPAGNADPDGTEEGGVALHPDADYDEDPDSDDEDEEEEAAARAERAGLGDGGVLRCMCLQIRVLENHQNGKDTHVRGVQLFARDERAGAAAGGAGRVEGPGLPADARLLPEEEAPAALKPLDADWLPEPEVR